MIYIVLILLYLFSSNILSFLYHRSEFVGEMLKDGSASLSYNQRKNIKSHRKEYLNKSFLVKKFIDFIFLIFIALSLILVFMHSLFTNKDKGGK